MSSNAPRFRWWYLLFLLPVALYFGARWYVGHRIERAIEQANEDGNRLTVSDYAYGFFPIHLEASGIDFDQDRDAFNGRGTLNELYVGGLDLFSLFGSDPVEMERIRLGGLDAEIQRKSTGTGGGRDSSSFALEVSEIEIDSTFLLLTDAGSGKSLDLRDFSLSLQAFRVPLQLTELRSLRVAADSVRYTDPTTDTRIAAGGIGYGTDREAIRVADLRLRRGDSTDVRAEQLLLTGLNAGDVDGELTIDSVYVARLGGRARVPGGKGQAGGSGSPGSPIRVADLQLPQIDVRVAGDFGRVDFAGSLSASTLAYRDTFSAGRIAVTGDRLDFSNGSGLAALLRDLEIQQENLTIPLAINRLGQTDLSVPDFTLTRQGQTISGSDLSYRSPQRELSANRVELEGKGRRGSADRIRITGIDRAALLDSSRTSAALEQAVVEGIRFVTYNKGGGRYEVRAPQVTLDAISVTPGFAVARVQVENAGIERYDAAGARNMTGRGIYIDQRDISAPVALTRMGPVKLRMAELRMTSGEEPLDYVYLNLAYDSRAGRLTLDSLQRRNSLSPDEMFRQRVSKSWLDFGFDGLRLEGIRHNPLVRGEMVYVDSLFAKDFRLRVVEDLSLDLPGNPNRPMPVEALRKIGPRIVLNGARFSSTDIAYGVVDSLLDPKTIHFNDGRVLLSGLDTEISDTDSVRVTMDATFEKGTPLHAEFHLSRDAVARGYAARGELGTYDLSKVNPLMRVAADAIIEKGIIEKLTYDSRMDGDTITGDMVLLYRDLDLKVVGSGAWIKNLLSGVVVKNDNSRGEDFRMGRIYHVHTPERSFFNSYWKGLVSGMKSSAMSDIALPEELD